MPPTTYLTITELVKMLLNPFWPSPFPHLINDPFLKQFYLNLLLDAGSQQNEWELEGCKEYPVISSLFQLCQRKRGSWGCQECDVLIGTNLQICIARRYLIISLFCLVAMLPCLRGVTKPLSCLLGGFLRDKEAAAATSFFEGSLEMRHHCLNTSK